MKKVIPRKTLERVASRSLEKVVISKEDLAYLKPYFAEDINKLEKLLNKDLSDWK